MAKLVIIMMKNVIFDGVIPRIILKHVPYNNMGHIIWSVKYGYCTKHIEWSIKMVYIHTVSKVGVSSRWSFRPNSAWGSIETMTMEKTHPTLKLL